MSKDIGVVNKWILLKHKCKAVKDQNMNAMGIYAIVNKINGHSYVGQTSVSFTTRRRGHLYELRRGSHGNPYLQNAFDCYGEFNFRFKILEYVFDPKSLNEREQYWIDELQSEYNIVKDIAAWNKLLDNKRECPDGRFIMDGESFSRPMWHKWVYGGCQNPLSTRDREIKFR